MLLRSYDTTALSTKHNPEGFEVQVSTNRGDLAARSERSASSIRVGTASTSTRFRIFGFKALGIVGVFRGFLLLSPWLGRTYEGL